jgi:hypothetical protein
MIFDQCAPPILPQANTLFIGSLPPPDSGWTAGERQGPPTIVDVDQVHPLSQQLAMGNVQVIDCTPLKPPKGSVLLMEGKVEVKIDDQPVSQDAVLYAVAPRAGFEDAVLGFEIVGVDGTKTEVNTNWTIRQSFPVFVLNAVKYLGGVGSAGTLVSLKPGQPAILRAATGVQDVTIQSPGGEKSVVPRESQNTFVFSRTDVPGIYDVREGSGQKVSQQFAVNLFDGRESDLRPRPEIEIGHEEIQATVTKHVARRELWRWLLFLALGVLLFEWYVYNKRVFI